MSAFAFGDTLKAFPNANGDLARLSRDVSYSVCSDLHRLIIRECRWREHALGGQVLGDHFERNASRDAGGAAEGIH
ncbi:MAG: hypothetical protein ACTHM9_14185 [Gemmatimonadales bacterium]